MVRRRLEIFRVIRKSQGYSQERLGKEGGWARTTVAVIEGGHQPPWPAFKRRCAEILGVPEAVLFGEVDE